MCFGACNVFTRQTPVEIDGGIDLLHDFRRTTAEPGAPHFVGRHHAVLSPGSPNMNPRTRLTAVLAGAAAIVTAAVLYGIGFMDVHATAAPPAVLNRLNLTTSRPAAPDIGFVDAAGRKLSL